MAAEKGKQVRLVALLKKKKYGRGGGASPKVKKKISSLEKDEIIG